MKPNELPLGEVSIEELFFGNVKCTYEIPIYQRNYAWEKEEITALIQDIYDSYKKNPSRPYYIGTLVSYHKGDDVFEVIDGQQRLTTIRILLAVLGIKPGNKLTYRARKKSDDTLKVIPDFDKVEERDNGIVNGFRYAKTEVDDLLETPEVRKGFIEYFRRNVHIVHYRVPKDIDLNHYFEIMNSRGEQLEKHEIVKAQLMEELSKDEHEVFNIIWECCSGMSVYVQQNLKRISPETIFGNDLKDFLPVSFEEIANLYRAAQKQEGAERQRISIAEILENAGKQDWKAQGEDIEIKDSFQPIIDFPNFLLVVLKMLRMEENGFAPDDFTLDDKELLNEFHEAKMDAAKVRRFAYLLLKSKYLLDNYMVHHSKEEDTMESNPWKLQVWQKDRDNKKGLLRNLVEHGNASLQDKLVNLLSMFEVTFTARQRKNYLFYCLLYLLKHDDRNPQEYASFVEGLADRYFFEVYMDPTKLNEKNRPIPGGFDMAVLDGHGFNTNPLRTTDKALFEIIYGDGTVATRGVPLFIFNYLDYKLWKLYDQEMRGEGSKEGSAERRAFFAKLGCDDFGLKVFDLFYFSRTRRSLEHYYPQAMAIGEGGALNRDQINCLGNFAMIGSEANSSGSNWSPKTKLDHYLDSSRKISQISVASLKFMIMMTICDERRKWEFEEIREHQEMMEKLLLDS